jgi:long-chain acyl-CoA synthetase
MARLRSGCALPSPVHPPRNLSHVDCRRILKLFVAGEDLHVLDDEMRPCQAGTPGTLWFKSPIRRRRPRRIPATVSLCTVGDIGYVDEDGYLYLIDRAAFTIISGGVNFYPQECESLLITHPKVADAAVFSVPNDDLGEEV